MAMSGSGSFTDVALYTTSTSNCDNNASVRVPSGFLCYGSPNDLLACEPASWASYIRCPSPPPPTSSPNTTTGCDEETRQCGTARYKMMGLASEEEAMHQLDNGTHAVLFHDEEGRLLLAVESVGLKFLLRVKMQIYSNGDRYWGVEGENKQIWVAFKNKERLLQFYAICPQAAIMSYFDV